MAPAKRPEAEPEEAEAEETPPECEICSRTVGTKILTTELTEYLACGDCFKLFDKTDVPTEVIDDPEDEEGAEEIVIDDSGDAGHAEVEDPEGGAEAEAVAVPEDDDNHDEIYGFSSSSADPDPSSHDSD